MRIVRDLKIKPGMSVSELVEQFGSSGGFTAPKVARAVEIVKEMKEKGVEVFLSFTADIISTGTRGAIISLLESGLVNHIVTTAGTVDHDIARAYSNYYSGDFSMDDISLLKAKKYRLGNVVIPSKNYGPVVEKKVMPFLERKYGEKKKWSVSEILRELGKEMREGSILRTAYEKNIDIFVPGYTDGSFGSQLWSFWEMHRDFAIDSLEDEHKLSDIVFSSKEKKMGAIIIGGGISKHHVIWWNQFRGGLDYAVYISTAQEFDGSLSGAQPREAVSWGKIKPGAKHVLVEGEATVILPIIAACL
ncbi:MAG: deoxyhypusine synthase [Thermoplasmatales archaeon]